RLTVPLTADVAVFVPGAEEEMRVPVHEPRHNEFVREVDLLGARSACDAPVANGQVANGRRGGHRIDDGRVMKKEAGREDGQQSLYASCWSAFSMRRMPSAASSADRLSGGRKRID